MEDELSQIDRIIKGMEIIKKYATAAYPCVAEHDVFFCGSYDTRKKMTKEERSLMKTYGWFEEEGYWAFYT